MRLPSRQYLIPMIIACALFMENMDSTVISTALPAIAHSLGESPLRLNLAITSYLLSLAVFIPLSGWMADRFGARTVFRAAIVVFSIGSALCGQADSLSAFVASRILQGMGGAMMVPVGRLVVLRTVPKSDLVRAMAYLTLPALIGPVAGPPLGGFIVTYYSWRWIFYINLPIGVLGIVLATLFIDNTKEPEPRPLDLRGFVLVALGLVGLMFGFETVGRGVLPAEAVVALLATGVAGIGLYALHMRRAPFPVLDLSLMRIPTFSASIMGGSLFRIGIGALPFLLPMMLQLGFGMTPFESGLLTFASAAGAMTMKAAAGPILRSFGFRPVLIGNALISSVFLFGYSLFSPSTPHVLIFVMLLAGGFFRSLQFTSINTIAYADVSPGVMSRATTLSSVAQQLSLSIGVGIGALMLHLTLVLHGRAHLTAGDFAPAMAGVGVIALCSVFSFLRLSPQAGAEVSGRRRRAVAGAADPVGQTGR